MPQLSSKIVALRDTVRQQARTHLKAAAIGGDQDQPFEQAFSNLAHAYLKDKAPSLLDYEVGFQLIERNQESTKAVGVFGFKVGSQWLYAPVFFINGELKGHELLYIKNEDTFVPMKENWLNYLLNRKPSVLGDEVNRNLRDIGVIPPHLYQLSRSPNKFASAVDHLSPWVKEAMPTVAYWATTDPAKDDKYKDIVDLPTFLKKEGIAVVQSLVLGFKTMPKLAEAFQQFHDLSVIDEAIALAKTAAQEEQSTSVLKKARCVNTPRGPRCFKDGPRPVPQKSTASKSVLQTEDKPTEVNTEPGDSLKTAAVGKPFDKAVGFSLEHKLRIVTLDEVMQHGSQEDNLTDKDREKLVKDRVLIKDDRPGAAVAYETQSTLRLQNPTETGLYDVLVRPDKFAKCLVIYGPYSQRERKNFVTLVRVADGDDDKGRAWINTHPAYIWVGKQYTNEEYQDWWKKLPEAKDFSVSRHGLCLVIGNTGEGSLPFSVEAEISTGDRKIFDVWFKSYADRERPGDLPPINTSFMHYRGAYGEDHGSRVQLTGKRGARLRSTGGDLYIPDDYRKLTLRPDRDDDGPCFCSSSSDPPPIQPGNPFDIDILLGVKTATVKMSCVGTEFIINEKRLQKVAALIHLVRDWGLREKQARILLKRAEAEKVTRFRIEKKALQEYELQQTGPSAPSIPEAPTGYDVMTGGNTPTQNMGEWNVKIPEMSASNTDRMIYHPAGPDPEYQATNEGRPNLTPNNMRVTKQAYDYDSGSAAPDQQTQHKALEMAQTGQKEIFDTAMIGSLLKAVRDDSMVDKYMPDLMQALDRLGRILFLFYWHGEKFQDRYGKNDMVEFEDGLRNAFEYLGDITLFLKQRSVDTPEIRSHAGVDLGEVANN